MSSVYTIVVEVVSSSDAKYCPYSSMRNFEDRYYEILATDGRTYKVWNRKQRPVKGETVSVEDHDHD